MTATWQERFRALQPDWDSYGGLPIDERAIVAMEKMLPRLGLPLWLTPTPKGGVQAEACTNGNYEDFEIWVDANGETWHMLIGPVAEPTKGEEPYRVEKGLTATQIVDAVSRFGVRFDLFGSDEHPNCWKPS
jgi:hypothetical protein